MSVDVGQMIARVLQGAGQGIEYLRCGVSDIVLRDCTIEVSVDDSAPASADVRIVLHSQANLPDQPE